MAAVLVRGGARDFCRALMSTLLLFCLSRLVDVTGSTHCPSVNLSVPEGSSGMILANVSRNRNLILSHKNSSSTSYDSILAITEIGNLSIYKSTYMGHFSIVENNLFIKNTSLGLAGEYRFADYMSQVCVHHVFLSVPDPWHCPSASFSVPENFSGMIIPNIVAHSDSLVLYKQNHSSSSGQYILSIAKGYLNHSVSTYEEHFYLSDRGLAIKNAYEGLSGEYQLVNWQNKSCVLQFFLNIPGSMNCSSRKFSIPAGPSEMIIPNISTKYDDKLLLYRKNHSTSAWQLILSITEEGLNFSTGTYEGCFNVSNNGLTFKNGCDGLPGEYLLWHNDSCVLKLFLNRPGHTDTNIWVYIVVIVILLLPILILCLVLNCVKHHLTLWFGKWTSASRVIRGTRQMEEAHPAEKMGSLLPLGIKTSQCVAEEQNLEDPYLSVP